MRCMPPVFVSLGPASPRRRAFEIVLPLVRSAAVRIARYTSVLWMLLLVLFSAASRGSVPPGTSIDNQATASYTASSGTSTTAGSNVVHVITQAGAATV